MKSRLRVWVAVTVIVVLAVSVALYHLYREAPASMELIDGEDDVALIMGTEFPGMVDVIRGRLGIDGNMFNITLVLGDTMTNLGEGEIVQWNATLFLENESDVLRAYEVCVELNWTHLRCYMVELGEQWVKACQVDRYGNSLTTLAFAEGLQNVEEVEWNIVAVYDRYSGEDLVASAFDVAPDSGLQRTVVKT